MGKGGWKMKFGVLGWAVEWKWKGGMKVGVGLGSGQWAVGERMGDGGGGKTEGGGEGKEMMKEGQSRGEGRLPNGIRLRALLIE